MLFAFASACAIAFADGAPPVAPPPATPAAAPELPSPIVYPSRPQGLIMSHATPAHRELACTRCHDASEGNKRLLPSESACASCHASQIDHDHPSAATCGACHRGFDPKKSPAIAPVRGEPARLTVSHDRHAAANVSCTQCHGDPAAAPAANGGKPFVPHMPAMSDCLSCHTGKQARALPCNGCHVSLPSGRLRTRFPEGRLVPHGAFLGLAHDTDFSVRHRWLAADESAACNSCHVEKDCTECHDGERRPRGLHPNDYLALHAQEAERNAARCNSCHTTQSFCLPCHARLGVAPLSAPDLVSPKRFHPPSGVWIRGPMQHAREAERSLATCTSCHVERDCVACHGGRGVGGGISPHPPGFTGQCAARMDANPRACATCHNDLARLRAACR
ncbi:MAG TPA: cytochrome c3 family protein, partial [Polyangiales bacterium]|nr:cytochrome c3 family protein [Polyangiales bacterium]